MKARSLVIAIDCDDVLVPAGQITIDAYNSTYGTEIGLADLYDSPPEVWGVHEVDEVLKRLDVCLSASSDKFLQPFPEVAASIKRLAAKHELHLVTGRRDFLEPITRSTLDTFFTGCFRTIEHTNHYAPSGEAHLRRSKGEVCRQLGADILIDDHIAHIKSAIDAGVPNAILFGEYPWSKTDTLPAGVTHCRDWSAAEAEIERIAGEVRHG